jgi:hypothetical protein
MVVVGFSCGCDMFVTVRGVGVKGEEKSWGVGRAL